MKTFQLPKKRLVKKLKETKDIFNEAAFLQSKKDMYEEMGIALEDSFDGDLFV